MQKQKTAKPHSGFEDLDQGTPEIAVPDINKAIAEAEAALSQAQSQKQEPKKKRIQTCCGWAWVDDD